MEKPCSLPKAEFLAVVLIIGHSTRTLAELDHLSHAPNRPVQSHANDFALSYKNAGARRGPVTGGGTQQPGLRVTAKLRKLADFCQS